LQERDRFPESEWVRTDCPIDVVIGILTILKQQLMLPNYFLLPDDPLGLVFLTFDHDCPHQYVAHYIRKALDITLTDLEFRGIKEESKGSGVFNIDDGMGA
jgi:hypothetical protein